MIQIKHCALCLHWFSYDDRHTVNCLVNHTTGGMGQRRTCCHYGETEIEEPVVKPSLNGLGGTLNVPPIQRGL